jgi:hypothetical protein
VLGPAQAAVCTHAQRRYVRVETLFLSSILTRHLVQKHTCFSHCGPAHLQTHLTASVTAVPANSAGVPLLLGSLYGADFLQAALAASALPQQASLVLADQPQALTIARFKALAGTVGALQQLLAGVFGTAHAEVRAWV